ncbi:MAG: type I restriction endonuclease subunit R [Bacteroidota bacterium]
MKSHTEQAFEQAIENSLLTHGGYIKGEDANFNNQYAVDTKFLFQYLKTSQPKQWEKLRSIHNSNIENKVLYRLNQEMENRGMLDVIRNGFTDNGVKFHMAFFKPETSLNPETEKQYNQNILSITRQIHYSEKNENAVDIVLFLNGLPVATVELKNQFTQQNTQNAKKQYIEDRDNRETLFRFKRGALVHFAVDTDEVYMTTKLEGKQTFFIPFNRGHNNGAGNPPNPEGYKTAYLWEYVWQKDSWMDIIGRFIHLQQEERMVNGKIYKKEKMIFPRYHQLDCVRRLSRNAKNDGVGKNYLVQHSAGSGKSNSIAWLAYRLFSLHNEQNENVFHAVVVITDRKVLDKQLQDTIYQFEHKHGIVEKIEKNSHQLRDALINGNSIIITTLQKFPFILDSIEKLSEEKDVDVNQTLKTISKANYAVIVDEAHSSQGGEASKQMKEILGSSKLDSGQNSSENNNGKEEPDAEDLIRQSMLSRGQQPNMSFFAFTATPKPKTLEVFGETGQDGKPRPFHLYSMRQAIEEGFILDVLKNYMTYKTFFKISQKAEDKVVNKKKASRAIARFLSLHPYNLAQKTEVMIEHFRQVASKNIGGKAKAMVVTSSRLHAVRYYFEFKKYIENHGYKDIKPLVAFSGTVKDPDIPDEEYTEEKLNGIKESELPRIFDTDEYKLLVVAEKFQTGFDQPLLHTMYVDKKLSGVHAVQTLSRLNRPHPGKENTFVLDFANEEEEIKEAFQPFYQQTTVSKTSDPNRLYDLKNTIESKHVIWQTEVDNFNKEYFSKPKLHKNKIHALMNSYIDPAVERFKAIENEEEQDDLKNMLTQYVRSYRFLSQVIPFQDLELEKFYAYTKLLLNKLPKEELSERFSLGKDEVSLEYYRLQKTKEGEIALDDQPEYGLNNTDEAGFRKEKEEEDQLSSVIETINDRFGTNFKEADRLLFDQVGLDLAEDETIIKQAKTNTFDSFKKGKLEDLFYQKLIDRMDMNDETSNKLLNNKDLANAILFEYLAKVVFEKVNV